MPTLEEMEESTKQTHGIYHDFCQYMAKWYFQIVPNWKLGADENGKTDFREDGTIKEFDVTKLVGYEAMIRIEKYVKKHPEIRLVTMDDDVFSTSYIVLIPHPTMGITMIIIPQCTTVQNVAFLYPMNAHDLIEEIAKMQKEYHLGKD